MSSLERLLVLVKNLARQEVDDKLKSQVNTIVEKVDNEEEKIKVLKLFLLICVMKRTHVTSQAPGVAAGASGEKKQLRQALVYFAKEDMHELVKSTLPIVPIYGCWSDLRVIGEELYAYYASSNADLAVENYPILVAICKVFADQFTKDQASLKESDTVLPSTAYKFGFHFERHDNHRTAVRRNKAQRIQEKKFTPRRKKLGPAKAAKVAGYTKRVGRGHRSVPTSAVSEDLSAVKEKSISHKANVALSTYITTTFLFPGQTFANKNNLEAKYRKYFKSFRDRVLSHKACIENFACKQQWNAISFTAAPKAGLDRYKKALEKHGQKSRMLAAMKKDEQAISNMEDINKLITDLIDEYHTLTEHSLEAQLVLVSSQGQKELSSILSAEKHKDMLSALIISKSMKTMKDNREEIMKQTREMYAKLTGIAIAEGLKMETNELTVSIPIVDTMNCVSFAERAQLVLAAYMIARMHDLPYIYVNGQECYLSPLPQPEAPPAPQASEVASATDMKPKFSHNKKPKVVLLPDPLTWLLFIPVSTTTVESSQCMERLEQSFTLMKTSGVIDEGSNKQVDVLFLCRDFTVPQDEFAAWLVIKQSDFLRNLQVHRVRNMTNTSGAGSAGTPFKPRRIQSISSTSTVIRSEMSLDFLFLLDLTGSMQSHINAARSYLLDIIKEVQSSTGVKEVRFAFVGYRDYGDRTNKRHPRFVVHDFTTKHEEIITLLQKQDADGGGDCPEDMLGGLMKALTLSWQSPVRVMTIVTDAPAHGYNSRGKVGDDYPTGRCPDQAEPHLSLPQAISQLAYVHQVDTLFVRCTSGATELTEEAIQAIYPTTTTGVKEGFGVLDMLGGAELLRTRLCDGLSSALNYLFTAPDQAGITTSEGNTLSALVSCACVSLRQSIRAQFPTTLSSSSSSAAADSVKPVESGYDVIGVEDVTMEEVEDEDEVEEIEDEAVEEVEDAARGIKDSHKRAAEKEKAAESVNDFDTLLQNLSSDFLSLAREALQVSIEEIMAMKELAKKLGDFVVDDVAEKAEVTVEDGMEVDEEDEEEKFALKEMAMELVSEGATVGELMEENAPRHIIESFVKEVKTAVEHI